MANPENVNISPFASNGIVVPDCVTYAGSFQQTEQQFMDRMDANGYHLLAIYTNVWAGALSRSTGPCTGPQESYEDDYNIFINTYPHLVNPIYFEKTNHYQSAVVMSNIVWSDDSSGSFVCGESKSTWSTYCLDDSWRNGATFTTTVYYYGPDTGFSCPENSHYGENTCLADEGWVWDEGSGKFVPVDDPCGYCFDITGSGQASCGDKYTVTITRKYISDYCRDKFE